MMMMMMMMMMMRGCAAIVGHQTSRKEVGGQRGGHLVERHDLYGEDELQESGLGVRGLEAEVEN